MCVLCLFYIDWELGYIVRVGLQETNNFFRAYTVNV